MEKIPVAVLIGSGSKLPAIVNASFKSGSRFKISVVVSHKRNSPGVNFAIENRIPATFFNLVDFRAKVVKDPQKARGLYSKTLGWFLSQKEYAPKLLVFAGWDLILDNNFFDFFKSMMGDGYCAINIHPALMPLTGEKKIKLPDGSFTFLIKGEQEIVLQTVLREKYTFFGPTVHWMNPREFDTGSVIAREFIKVGNAKSIDDLRKKLMPVEDKILVDSIDKITTAI